MTPDTMMLPAPRKVFVRTGRLMGVAKGSGALSTNVPLSDWIS